MYGLPKGGDVGNDMNNNLNCIHPLVHAQKTKQREIDFQCKMARYK